MHKSELNDFLPAAIEVRERAAHPATHFTGATIIGLLLLLLAWAYRGEIDIVARAEGKIIPLGQVRRIQSAESGVVRQILTQEGALVAAGQVLIELSPTLIDSEIERIQIELDAAEQQQQRQQLMLEFIDLNELQHEIPASEDTQLLQTFSTYQMRLLQLKRQLEEREAAKSTARQTIEKLEALEPVLNEQVRALKRLSDSKMGARLDYLKQKQALIELVHQQKSASAQQLQLDAEIKAIQSEVSAYISETKAQTLAQIEDLKTQSASLQEQLIQFEERRANLHIKAPISGRVKDLAVYTKGAVLAGAEQVMTIVPIDERLEVEAWLENRDIGFVSAGDSSEIKLETFPFTKYGVLHGEVIDLSADATQTETGLIYKARIALNTREIEVDNRVVSLMPGMGVTAEIRTGKRRVIDYVFDPLMRYRNESLRER